MRRPWGRLFFIASCLILSQCAPLHPGARGRDLADGLAAAKGWQKLAFDTGPFVLTGYAKNGQGNVLVIYIEGDGQSWITRHRPASDPTPSDPTALKLALSDPAPRVLYLGRPCQYTSADTARQCHPRHWTTARYSLQVIQAMDNAVDQAKSLLGAQAVELVGYSGGGAIAVILASRRSDVLRVITVAGNLDHRAWTTLHGVTPLWESLNPMDVAEQVGQIPQVHFVGAKDDVVPPSLTRNFVRKAQGHARLVVVEGFGHHCCWTDDWASLLTGQALRP